MIDAMVRARLYLAVACVVIATMAVAPLHAQDYPARPVKIIAPSAPGGGFDLVGRVLGAKLSERTGQQFVVENRPGSGTLLGTQAVARATPDGYTLLVGGLSNIALNMGMYRAPGYDALLDLTPISLVVSHSYMLVARRDLPFDSLQAIIAHARSHPDRLTIATSGPGTGQHVGSSVITRALGVEILLVPYKGAQAAWQDLLAGRVDLFYDNTTTAKPYVDSGRAKAVAISSEGRSPALPNVPSFRETRVFDWEMESWFGLFAPARTPPAVIERLRLEIDRATALPEVRAALEQGSGRSLRLTPPETTRLIAAEVEKWVSLVRKAGVMLD